MNNQISLKCFALIPPNAYQFQFSGPKEELISQFVNVTKIKSRNNAGWVLKEQEWDLDRAISWFYQHRYDKKYKDALETEDELTEEGKGNIVVSCNESLCLNVYVV